MARIYDVECLRCGHKWEWCKYDRPYSKCPNCGRKIDHAGEPYFVNGFLYNKHYNPGRVIVHGV